MRENRPYASEGGEAQINEPSLPLSAPVRHFRRVCDCPGTVFAAILPKQFCDDSIFKGTS